MPPELSVIIAVNNEEENIGILYTQLKKVLESINRAYEITFVDDGSQDNSYIKLCDIHKQDKAVNLIKLNKNFGQTTGLLVGMNFVRSGVIITLDGDFQHDPEDIPKLLEKIDAGYDFVNGKKINRQDSLIAKTWPSLIAKRLICFIFGFGYFDINSTFRAYRYKIVEGMMDKGEMFRFLPLMTKTGNIRFCEVDITCNKRRFGKTHYHFIGRMRRLSKDISLLLSIKNERNIFQKIDLNHFISETKFHQDVL